MRKVLSLLLCVMMVLTMMPSMAFAEGSNLPGQLYWSGVSNSVTDGSQQPTDIEWYGDGGMPIGFTDDTVRRVYLGVKDADGNIQPISPELDSLECGSNISITGRDGYIYTLTAQEVNAQTWIRYTESEQDYELGIDIALGGEDSENVSSETVDSLVFGDEVGIVEAVAAETMTLEAASGKLYFSTNITANQPLEKYIYIATYGKDENGGPNMSDLRGVQNIPTEDVTFIADYPGEDGSDVVGDDIKDLSYSVSGSKLTATYSGAGNDTFAENNARYRINMRTANRSYGTLHLWITEDQDDGEQPPAGNLPGTLYWAEADKVTGSVTQDDLDNSEIWHTTLTPQAGTSLNAIFVIKEGDAVVFINDPTTIATGNESVVKVSGCNGNVMTLEFKQAGSSWLRASLDSGDYELGVTVSGSGGGNSSESKWHMIFSDVVIDGGNRPSNLSQTRTGVRISGTSSYADYYLYLVRFDSNNNILELEPVTTENFEIYYLRGTLENGNPDHITGEGVEFRKIDDGIDGTENYYRILTDSARQTDYDKGEGMYDVWPRAEGDNRLIYNSWIDTSGANEPPKEPYDILVLSTRSDLAELTEQQIMDTFDFAIIEPSLTDEDRTFTGYVYVATREYINNHWVYTQFRTLYKSEGFFADYTGPNDSWPNSIDGSVTGLTWSKNDDGSWTFMHHGDNTDSLEPHGNTYGYSVGVYKPTPDGGIDSQYCECMPFQFAFLQTAPVQTDVEYALIAEQLRDPSEIKDWPFDTSCMWVNGQGRALLFNSKITSWYSSFFVRNTQNDYDARYIKTPNTNEIRTYIGAEKDYVLEARDRNGGSWVPITGIDEKFRVFSLEYIGAKKDFYPVFQIKFDAEEDDAVDATGQYQFRIRYKGADPYLDNGNTNNSRVIELYREEDMVEFDIDEYWFDEVVQRWNTGNVLHFDYIGTTIKTKLNIRPGVLKSVADKTWYDVNDYIFIENEAENIRFYAQKPDANGRKVWTLLDDEECPFTVTWDDAEKVYYISYDHHERDLYGPHYMMKYIGEYNEKINAVYGHEEGTEHQVQNDSAIITGKLTLNVDKVGEDGFIDATTDNEIVGTEVIFGEDAVGNQKELKINTNDGSVTLGGALVGNIKVNENKVHFKMWNVKEEEFYLTDDQKKVVDKCGKAFDFQIDTEDADIAFGEDGYATIRIPYDGEEGYIYYINEKGEKEYIACECKDGYIEFTAKHFSVYGISPRELGEEEDDEGLAVLYNGKLIGSGSTIRIPECGGFSLPIYYDGQLTDGTWAMGDTSDRNVSGAGVSPDYKAFEVYLSGNAVAGDKCEVTLYYGDRANPISANFNVEVTPGIRLTYNNGNTTVMPNGTISGKQKLTVQIVYDGNPVTSGYQVGTEGNCICDVKDNKDGTLTITTLGNGYGDFSVWYGDLQSNFTWNGSGVADSDQDARNVVMEIDGVKKQTGEQFVLDGSSTFTGKIYFNGVPFNSDVYTIRTENGKKCSAKVNTDGSFDLETYDISGYVNLVFEWVVTNANGDKHEYSAVFPALISAPEAYILQFQNMEQLADGSWRKAGMATLGVFKKNKQANYVKYVVTDELMRPVSTDHYVDVDPDEILIIYYDPSCGQYVPVPDDMVPFTFEMVPGQDDIMRITYYQGKDKLGPEYKLVYTNLKEDPYLSSTEHRIEDSILLWTSSVSDFVKKDKLQGENHRWHYNAKIETYGGVENVNDECDVKFIDVSIQGDLFGEGENQVEIVEDQSTLEIETDLGSVIFDDKVLTQIDNVDKDVTLNILNVEKDDAEYKAFESALKDATYILDLNLSHEDGVISDFEEGQVTVKLNYELTDPDKMPHVYYVDDEGGKHLMECTYDAETKELIFHTNHFSLYEVEEPDYAAYNVQTDTNYYTVSDAMSDAKKSHTVKLVNDSRETQVLVRNGVTVDLNGFTLEAEYFACFGHVVDNSEENTGVLVSDNVLVQKNNEQLPIKNDEGNYQFFEVTDIVALMRDGKTSRYFASSPKFERFAHSLIAKGSDISGLSVIVKVKAKKAGADEYVEQDFVYSDQIVKGFADSYSYDTDTQTGSYKKHFMLTINNVDKYENITCQVVIKTAPGVELKSDIVAYK